MTSNIDIDKLHKLLTYLKYNSNNVEITKEYINDVLTKHGINTKCKPDLLPLYQEAVTHLTYTYINKKDVLTKYKVVDDEIRIEYDIIDKMLKDGTMVQLKEHDYDTIEVHGDKVIDYCVTDYICKRYGIYKGKGFNQGFITKLRSRMVRTQSLAMLSKQIGLDRYLLISKSVEEKHGRNEESILEDIFEAFISALHDDIGIDKTKQFIFNLVERYLPLVHMISYENNYKELIVIYYKKNKWDNPKYKVLENDDMGIYKVGILDNSQNIIGIGVGPNKKTAEQLASLEALKYFGEYQEEL